MHFQELILKFHEFWKAQGCLLEQPYDVEAGAGTFHPATFFGALGKSPWRVAYVQPSRRPADGRYAAFERKRESSAASNPLRMQLHHQYQVLLKPPPEHIQELYLKSLGYLGISFKENDVKFVHNDWNAPTLGAWGLGWEIWLNGLEITQFTYFQQVGGIDLNPISVELAYGLERIAMFVQGRDNVFELAWDESVTYGRLQREEERQFSIYNLEKADIERSFKLFELSEAEAKRCLEHGLYLPAYDYVLKCSHLFNILEARKAISTTERERFIQRIKELAKGCAELYLKHNE